MRGRGAGVFRDVGAAGRGDPGERPEPPEGLDFVEGLGFVEGSEPIAGFGSFASDRWGRAGTWRSGHRGARDLDKLGTVRATARSPVAVFD